MMKQNRVTAIVIGSISQPIHQPLSSISQSWTTLILILPSQNQGRHNAVDRPEERGTGRKGARRSSSKGREKTNVSHATTGNCYKGNAGKLFRKGAGSSAYGLFRPRKYHQELNWTELKCFLAQVTSFFHGVLRPQKL